MPKKWQDRLETGIRNLLVNCAGLQPGQKLLVVHETESDGYFEPALTSEVCRLADQLGYETKTHGVPLKREVSDPDDLLRAMMEEANRTVFLARLGDQIRFRSNDAADKQIISYALDREMLASPFGTTDCRAFERLKQLINQSFASASEIHVICPAGTNFKGTMPACSRTGGDVTRKRFPSSVFAPIPADGFRGRIAQNGFLTGTGSHYYRPYSCALNETLFVHFEGTRITGFDGAKDDISAARAHYEFVGNRYGIDTYHVHSWHAGIHPGCAYKEPAARNFERWSGSAFGNPRLLHFHTCGAYPPGEISLNVLDPTIRIDGVAVWEQGRLHPERLPGSGELFDAFPELVDAFRNPADQVGQGECGRLVSV